MTRVREIAGAACLALLVSACANGGRPATPSGGGTPASGPADPRSPGACPAAVAGGSFPPVSVQLRFPVAWYRIGAVREVRQPTTPPAASGAHAEDDRRILVPGGVVAVRTHKNVTTRSDAFDVSAQAASEVGGELGRGAEVLVGVLQNGRVDTVLSVRKDGRVEFLGVCRHRDGTLRFEAAFQRMAAGGYVRSRREFLFAAIDDSRSAEAVALSTTSTGSPSWEDLSPDVRVLAPDAQPPPPAALLASLTQVHLTLRLPSSWSAFPGGLCTRTRNGWTECALLSVASSGDIVLTAYAEAGERPQVWLVEDVANFASAVGKAGEGADEATLVGDPTVATYDALRERVREGQPVLR